MTLWFDVSDLCIWDEPQLTGIQRTVLSVLTELEGLRSDVRLFRWRSRRLAVLNRSELPWLRTEDCGVLRAGPDGIRPPWAQRARRLVRRYAGEDITALLAQVRNLPARLQASPGVTSRSPLPNAGRRHAQLFAAGDVCISLSATWQFPRYTQLVAGQKALAPVACVSLLYDLVPHLFPQWAGAYHARRFTLWAQRQIRNADLLLAISDFQKREIEGFIRANSLPPRTIATIRLGDDHRLTRGSAPRVPAYKPERPFILCVSTIDARKNLSRLHRVWHRLTEELGGSCPELVLVGMTHASGLPILRAIRGDPCVSRSIVHLTDVSDPELGWYYANCLFTIYPSLYEGWGLPVRESLAAGRYCISSKASSLPEAGGDLVDYFDPVDEAACLELVRRAIAQPAYVARREREVRAGFRLNSWRATALQISMLADQTRERVLLSTRVRSGREGGVPSSADGWRMP